MNVLILTTHFNTGGITSYVLTLAKGLIQKGHSVCVVSSGGDREAELARTGADHVRMDIRTKSEISYKVFIHLPAIIKLARERHCDVIHAQTRITQVMAAIISFWTKIPYVATCHGFFRPRLFRKIFPCWGKATIAISQQVQKHLIDDFGCVAQKVFLVPHGLSAISQRWSAQEKSQRRSALQLRPGPIVGIVARLSDVKGQDVLIRAMKEVVGRVPEAHLVIVGEGKTEPLLRALVHELSLEECVHFFPVANSEESLLPLFDVFAMPSRQEGLGLSVMEAQAQGLAVVASHVGGIPSLIEHGKTGILVAKESAKELADAIVDLLEHPLKRVQLGQAAKTFAEKHFSLDVMVSETLNVYFQAHNKDEKHTCCQC